MKKRLLTIVLAVAVAASMVACSSSGGSSSSSGGTGTISILLSEEPGEGDSLTTMLNRWAEETGNTLDVQIIAYDDQLTKFPSMAKNNDLPDLIATTRLHQLYPEEFIDMRDYFDLSDFEETALKIVGQDYISDKITGLPYNYTTTCFFYNVDAFEQAGIEPPTTDDPWTWEELYENAQILQDSGAVKYGFAADVSRARYDILMYANGGSLTLADGDTFKVNVNCPENVATLERFVQANNDVMPLAIWAGATTDNPFDYFKNGTVGIYLNGSWNYAEAVSDITSFKFDILPSPVGSVSRAAIIGGSALAVPENAKNKDLAVEFLKWMYDEDNFQDYLQVDKGLSALTTVTYEPEGEDGIEQYKLIQKEVEYVTDTFFVDESSAWRNYKDNEYRDYLERAVAGEMTAEQALTAFAKELAESSEWELAN